MSVMHLAACMKNSLCLKQALAAKGDPNLLNTNASNSYRATPIWYATNNHHLENVRLLLDAGADVNAKIHHELTAFSYACMLGHFDVVLFLLQRKADYLKPAVYGWTAIDFLQGKIRLSKIGSLTKEELKELEKIIDWMKKDGFDPEKATWDAATLNWKQP